MRSLAKVKIAIVLGLLAMTLPVQAAGYICVRMFDVEPEHDWTCQVGHFRVGLRAWNSSSTDLIYGMYGTESIRLPVPFYGVVGGAGAFSAAVGSCVLFLFRRKSD